MQMPMLAGAGTHAVKRVVSGSTQQADISASHQETKIRGPRMARWASHSAFWKATWPGAIKRLKIQVFPGPLRSDF